MLPAEDAAPAAIVTLEGVVLERATPVSAGGALASFIPRPSSAAFTLRADRVVLDSGSLPVSGRVRVMVRGGEPGVAPGERVRLSGVAHPLEAPRNPGEADARLWGRQDHIAAEVVVASAVLIEPLPPGRSLGARLGRAWLAGRGWLRERAHAALGGGEPGAGRAMLGTLLLGVSDADARELRTVFARQGLAHVLAISGFHLAVMAGAALYAVRLTGDRGRLEPLVVAALVVLYVVILPVQAPILRSAAVVLVWLASESLGRRYDHRALLAWVAIGILAFRPMDLFSLGYQLTFGITAALVWFGEPVHRRMFPPRLEFRREPPDIFESRWWLDGAARLFSASVLCWLVATPLVATSVGIVSPTAVLSTLVVVPAVTILLWAGYIALIGGMLVPAAGEWMSAALERIASWTAAVVQLFDRLPGTTLYVPRLSIGLTAALTGLVLWWLVRGRLRSPGLWSATLLCAGWLAGELSTAGRTPAHAALRIDTLDVGDGACHLVRCGDRSLLWDCGSLSPSVGVRTIPRAIRSLGAWRVPDVVLTHANFDHYSGLPDAMAPLGVERVWVSPEFIARTERDPRGAAAACLEQVRERGVEVHALTAGGTLPLRDAVLRILSPPAGASVSTDNDHSLVARIAVRTGGGERTVMFCGDIQREAIAALLAPGAALDADVLELPHHGSVNPTALAFVAHVDPEIVLQSTGPSRAAEIRWNELRAGRRWWMTAECGAAWVEIRHDGEIASGSMRR
jgi:competence protein ComEC